MLDTANGPNIFDVDYMNVSIARRFSKVGESYNLNLVDLVTAEGKTNTRRHWMLLVAEVQWLITRRMKSLRLVCYLLAVLRETSTSVDSQEKVSMSVFTGSNWPRDIALHELRLWVWNVTVLKRNHCSASSN